MHELQQLDRELDVAQSARAELDLPVRLVERGSDCTTRRRIACTSATKSRAARRAQTIGVTTDMYSLRQLGVAGRGRAFSSAWYSQVCAQRW